jgi:hypothetical protein
MATMTGIKAGIITGDSNYMRKLVSRIDSSAIDYFEFGICGGYSFKWLDHNKNRDSNFMALYV